MIEIFTALYQEAKPLIEKLSLKSNNYKNLQCFINDSNTIRLTICGTGKINACYAVTTILNNSNNSYVINYGCGAYLDNTKQGLYIANCISDIDSGISYYPDILIDTDIEECAFLTGSVLYSNTISDRVSIKPINNIKEYIYSIRKDNNDYLIYDMESSAIYQSANKFIGPDRMYFIRYTSDNEANNIDSNTVSILSNKYSDKVISLINKLLSINNKDIDIDISLIDKFCNHINATKSIRYQIIQIVKYCIAANIDYKNNIKKYLSIEINNKEDSKNIFNNFKRDCCE